MAISSDLNGTKRADFKEPFDVMLTLVSFAITLVAVLGCIWWASMNDQDET